jgi:hypothetical protein
MIAFGCAISDPEAYRRYAEPGLRLAAEPDSELLIFGAVGSIARSYNLLMDAAAEHCDLEALALVHPALELTDASFCGKVREALADPDVAVLGCIGARNVRSIAWWEGMVFSAQVDHHYHELGGGQGAAFAWTNVQPAPAEVETVDGLLLVLSPWAVRNIRFDESLHLGPGYDWDYCLQVREAGRKVMVAELAAIQHRPLELVSELNIWVESHIAVAEKWNGRLPAPDAAGASWKQRARLAEAERESARAFAFSSALQLDARVLELEREFEQATSSLGWRLTAPLRRANQLRRGRPEPELRDARRSAAPHG